MTPPGIPLIALAFSLALLSPGHSQSKKKVKTQTITAIEGLRFSPVRFSMRRNELLQLKFVNKDPNDQPHNLVIIKPDSLKAIQDASLKIGPDSIANQYVPDDQAVLTASKLLESDETADLTFEPDAQGIYHFVCTFPGHAAVMYGAIYVDERAPGELASDPNVPKYVRDLEMQKLRKSLKVERPKVMRAFLPEAGPAAIAVALPDDLNYCWDAGNCRLRYAWTGAFVDPRAMLNSNGSRFTKVLGPQFWTSGGGENTFTIGTGNTSARPDFKGYRLLDGIPVFHYLLDGLEVRETLTPLPDGLNWNLKIEGASEPVKIFAPGAVESPAGTRQGDYWIVDPKAAGDLNLKIKSNS